MDSFGLLPKMPGLVILETPSRTPSRSESWYSSEVWVRVGWTCNIAVYTGWGFIRYMRSGRAASSIVHTLVDGLALGNGRGVDVDGYYMRYT